MPHLWAVPQGAFLLLRLPLENKGRAPLLPKEHSPADTSSPTLTPQGALCATSAMFSVNLNALLESFFKNTDAQASSLTI